LTIVGRSQFTQAAWRNAVLWRGTRIENPPSHFLADPFIVSKDGKEICFVEDFDYKNTVGKNSGV